MQAQKAKEKEEDHELKEKLDADFTALAQSNGLLSLVRPKKVDVLKSLLAKGSVLEGSSITKVLQGGDKTLEEKVLDTYLPHYFSSGSQSGIIWLMTWMASICRCVDVGLGLLSLQIFHHALKVCVFVLQEKPDEYDKLVKEMGFEIRGRATDRSKTAEELAKEELTRLEELEVCTMAP